MTPPGAEAARFEGHVGGVNALAVLPDGRLASASWDQTIRLWDLKSGAETARLEDHTGAVLALAPLPDGRLASAPGDQTIRLWDVKSGAEIARLEVDAGVHCLAALTHGLAAGDALGHLHRLEIVG